MFEFTHRARANSKNLILVDRGFRIHDEEPNEKKLITAEIAERNHLDPSQVGNAIAIRETIRVENRAEAGGELRVIKIIIVINITNER